MYLVDANVPLEFFLEQRHADDVESFLRLVPSDEMRVTLFSLYSVGITLTRHRRPDLYRRFMEDVYGRAGIGVVEVGPEQLVSVADTAAALSLDFDDAYQYVAAEQHGLDIVSFDPHFDHTPRGRRTPAQALAELGRQ